MKPTHTIPCRLSWSGGSRNTCLHRVLVALKCEGWEQVDWVSRRLPWVRHEGIIIATYAPQDAHDGDAALLDQDSDLWPDGVVPMALCRAGTGTATISAPAYLLRDEVAP